MRNRATAPWLALDRVLAATGGRLRSEVEDRGVRFTRCAIDSRTLEGGELFIPLPGTRTDGHEFIAAALRGGASGSLVRGGQRPAAALPIDSGKPLIEVADPLRALQQVGHLCRTEAGIPLVAVTGSNGKTTTKEMIAAVLATRRRVLKNEGNLNNHIGVPLTLSRLLPEHEVVVLELGMSARGEIRALAALAAPNVGVLTNAAAAHLATLGSVDEVARAKSELAEALPPEGLLVLNADDSRLWALNRARPIPIVGYALENEDADLRPGVVSLTQEGGARIVLADGTAVVLRLLGEHNARNALAAIAVGDHFGIPRLDAAQALGGVLPGRHRLELVVRRGVRILDDAYNANPASMREALALLARIETIGARRAVLADMLELGTESQALHEEVGRDIPADAWLYATGEHAAALERGALEAGVRAERIQRFPDVVAMAAAVSRDVAPGDLVLVKASRGMRLERVVEAIAPGASGGSPAVASAVRS